MYASLGARRTIRRLPALSTRVTGMRPDQREYYMACRPSDGNAGAEQRCYEQAMLLLPTTEVIQEALYADIEAQPGVAVPTWAYYAGAAVALVGIYAVVRA